jgi:hypothetical protein
MATDRRAADLDSNVASDRYAVTGELLTMTPYDIPRDWARVLHRAGFEAIKGRLRFSLRGTRGLSLFGAAGARDDWAVDERPVDAVGVARRMNLVLALPPDNEQLTIVNPP